MNRRTMYFIGAIIQVAVVCYADRPALSPSQLRQISTHVVTGEVKAVYSYTVEFAAIRTTHYVAEVKVHAIEKGSGHVASQIVYVRYFRRTRLVDDRQIAGQRLLPDVGNVMRFYINVNLPIMAGQEIDGGWNAISPRGIERIISPDGEAKAGVGKGVRVRRHKPEESCE